MIECIAHAVSYSDTTVQQTHRYIPIHGWGGAGACWRCEDYVQMLYEGTAAKCNCDHVSNVRAQPEGGCSAFEREVGTDNAPGPPVCVDGWAPCVKAQFRPR